MGGVTMLDASTGSLNATGIVTAVGGNTNNTDDAAVFKGTGTEHIKLLLDTSSTGGHRASVALESNSNEVNIATTGSDEMRFSTANTSDALFIKSDGNVGIGTTSPDQNSKLDVYSTTGSWTRISVRDATSSAFTGVYRQSGTVSAGIFAHNSALNAWEDLWINAHNNGSGGVGGGTSNKVIIGGNVGIGTTNPDNYYARDLVVNAADEGGITIVNGTSHQGYLMFADGTSGAQTYRGYIGYDHNIDHLQVTSGGIIKFLVNNNQEKMSITTSGVIQGASDAEIATSPIRTHSNTISTSTTIDVNDNAIASGPISVATGVTLTINGNMTVV
jgi:hypothetical protein